MAVRRLGKYYQIDYYLGKKRIREVLKGVTSHREAREIEAQRLRNGYRAAQFRRFSELAEWYLNHPDKQSKKTLDRDRQRYEQYLEPFFGSIKLSDVTPQLVDDYKAKRQRGSVRGGGFPALATINHELGILKAIFRFGLKKGRVSQIPQIDLFPVDNIRKRFIEEWEFEKILPHLAGDVRLVVVIAYWTGMRLGEILGLRWKNVDFNRKIFLFESEKGKRREERAVALAPAVIEVLQTLPRGFGETLLFNMRRERADRVWRRACKKARVKNARIHDLRATRATIWHMDQGLPRDLIMAMTGHKTDSMFRRYQIVSTKYAERLAQEWHKAKEVAEDEREGE